MGNSVERLTARARLARLVAGVLGALALLLGAPRSTHAQAVGTIRGRVIDAASQRPVPDVQLQVVGSLFGAITNGNGEYTIANVPAGQRIVRARRIGFAPLDRTVTVAAGQTVTADFSLSTSATQLSDVVVTGTTGAVERRTVGNAVTQIDVAELTSRNSIMNVSEVLQAKTPGVTILPGSGATGTAGEIRIRGASSVSGYTPVVFIDGIRYNISNLDGFTATGGGTLGLAQSSQVTSALNWLDPNDIESIEVIKGPAAATLYGAEAANGVIQIITKKGTKGQQALRWTFRGERGINDWKLSPADNYTTCDAAKQAATVSAADPSPLWPGCQGLPVNSVITGNPMMDDPRALRTGDLSRLSLSVRGGGDRYSFFLSGDRDVDNGVFYNNDQNRTSVRTNFSFAPSAKADFTVNVNWQDGRIRLPIQDESANGLLLSAVRGLPGRASLLGPGNEGWRTIAPDQANRYRNYTGSDRLTLGGTVNYNPFSWFRNRATVGIDNTTTQAQLLFLPSEIASAQDPDAAAGANLRRTPTARLTTLSYNGDLLWQPLKSLETTTSFGSQVVGDKRERLDATGIGLGAPDVTLVNLAQRSTGAEVFSENNSVGYYVQEQLGWNHRLFVTGAVRADDHSAFGTNFDLIVYPKFSVSYVVSEEPAAKKFIDALRINSLKLRGAWGMAGRAPNAYSAVQTYTVDKVTLGATTGSAARTSAFGNPDLKPEKGEEIELGFEASAFADRLGADFTYYDKTTTDMLQSVSIAPSTGFISSRLTNLGEVTNKGIELSLFGTPLSRSNLTWETRLSVATNKNELVTFGIPGKLLETPSGQAYGSVQQHRPGFPLGGFWVTPPQRNPDGSAVLTPTGAAIFNPGDTARRYIGPSTPTREIGFSNTITLFKYFRLYGLFDYKGGFYIFNLQERNRCQASDNCSRTNDPRARFPQTAADSILFKELAVYRSSSVSPEWIQKGEFIKLREVSLTIDVPRSLFTRVGAQGASLILSGRNLALWSDYEGVDPEVNSYGGRSFVRVDAYALPMTRRFSAGFNITYRPATETTHA
jgi:TonB-linked SusC/RagA family outer membrane protein